MTAPVQHCPTDPNLDQILALVRSNFAYMETRIDPPSSMHRLNLEAIAAHCEHGEVWSMGNPVYACVFFTLKPDCLYLGKLAVQNDKRGMGVAAKLVKLAETRASLHGKFYLELNTRIELIENHHVFEKLGFVKTADGRHEGYDRPTFIVMRKTVSSS